MSANQIYPLRAQFSRAKQPFRKIAQYRFLICLKLISAMDMFVADALLKRFRPLIQRKFFNQETR